MAERYIESQGTRTWKALGGALLFILGIAAFNAAAITSLALTFTLGWILLFGGFVGFFLSFALRGGGSIILGIVSSVLSFVLGGIMLVNPGLSLATLTLLLAMYFVVDGIIRVAVALSRPSENRGWTVFTGVVLALLGIAIWKHLPVSSLYIFGVFIGIGLILSGVTILATSVSPFQMPQRAHHA